MDTQSIQAVEEKTEEELKDESDKGILMSVFSFINDDHNLKMTLDEMKSIAPYLKKTDQVQNEDEKETDPELA